jgi:hypothetical protein
MEAAYEIKTLPFMRLYTPYPSITQNESRADSTHAYIKWYHILQCTYTLTSNPTALKHRDAVVAKQEYAHHGRPFASRD